MIHVISFECFLLFEKNHNLCFGQAQRMGLLHRVQADAATG